MSHAIQTEALTRFYGRTEAVRALDLAIPSGCVYALMGPNGAGKTTTIRLLLNLLRPTSGRATVLGVNSTRLGAADYEDIGYVSEERQLPDWMTVSQLVAYCCPFYSRWDDAFCARLLAQFRIPTDRPIRSLSRGMRLKAALLVALPFRPRLLVMDEPFGGLDPLVRVEIVEGMLDLAGQEGLTTLISSHDMNELERLADQAGFLDQGRLLFSEEMSTLLDRHREIVVSLEPSAIVPAAPPEEWLGLTRGERTLRFVDTAYEEARTRARIRTLFPGAGEIDAAPMPLRSIFVAHARRGLAEVPS